MKPNIGCQGRGICITNNINRLKRCDDVICQVYLQKPLLIDGYKFDLRVYALITSCDPLRIFVYNEGLARFATAKYCRPDSINAANQFMHLTNYSVNKHSQAYVVGDGGTKRRLSSINQWFVSNNHNLKNIWSNIDDAIIKTVMAALPTVRHEYHVAFPHGSSNACFEILGFDFIFDCQMRPYILEVNHSPSLHTDSDVDHEIKDALLQDAFNILNLQTTNREDILAEERKRAWERLFTVTRRGSVLSRERARNEMISNQKTAWENSHMGNFRKIYPGRKTFHYEQFLCFQSTLFSGTCSSRAKETSSSRAKETSSPKYKTTRNKLCKMHKIPSSKPSIKKSVVKLGKRLERKGNLKTKRPDPQNNQIHMIDEAEERDRLAAMKKRDSLVKSYGMFEKVFESFKNVGLIRKSEEVKMKEMFLDSGNAQKSCESSRFPNMIAHDTLESITKAMESADRDRANTATAKFSYTTSSLNSFQPSVIDEYEESERQLSREKRGLLLESIGIHKLVHDYFKLSGLLKIEERVKSKTVVRCQSSNVPNSFQRGKHLLKTKKLKKVGSGRSVETVRMSGAGDDRRQRTRTKKYDSDRSKKINSVVDQLEAIIRLWKERHKSGENFHRPPTRSKVEDSPEIWGTPPEEFFEAKQIQPEFWLNPEVP